jgi:hypothetical protein
MKRAVSGRGTWGVWITGGLRKAATSWGDGPAGAMWAWESWLICDCCWVMSVSSLSRRASGCREHLCCVANDGTYRAHGHSLRAIQASFAAGRRRLNGSSGTIRLQVCWVSARCKWWLEGSHSHAGWPRSHLTLRCLHVSQLTLNFSRLRFPLWLRAASSPVEASPTLQVSWSWSWSWSSSPSEY